MKSNIILSLFLLPAALAVSAQTPGATFSRSFNTEEKGSVSFDLPGKIDVKIWNNAYVRVEVAVSLANGNASLINELASVGRYNLTALTRDDVLVIQAPNLQKQVRFKGELLRENIIFTVYVPKEMGVELPNPATASAH